MYHLRRWHHPTTTAGSSNSATTAAASSIVVPSQQEPQQRTSSSSSQIPLPLAIAMKKMNSMHHTDDDYYYQDNIHTQANDTNHAYDEITMEDCTACRRSKCSNHYTTLISESTIQHCYYSITSLFRNHKKVILQDGLTKGRLARDDVQQLPTPKEDIDATHCSTGSSSSIDVPMQRQLVNEFDRTNMNGSKSHAKMVYHIDTSIVQQQELQPPNQKNTKQPGREDEEEDQMTALETPSPVHTDDETDDECDAALLNHKEPKHLKFFRRGKLV